MGLDSYITGVEYKYGHKEEQEYVDGARIKEVRVELAYWRKFWPLHTYIVDTFAKGVDEGQSIELSVANLRQIETKLRANEPPVKEEYESDHVESMEMLKRTIRWVGAKDTTRWAIYNGSW